MIHHVGFFNVQSLMASVGAPGRELNFWDLYVRARGFPPWKTEKCGPQDRLQAPGMMTWGFLGE